MATVKKKEEAQALLASRKRGGTSKEILFIKEIEALKKGEGLFISEKEWKMKTTPTAYYYGKFTKGKKVADRVYSGHKVAGGFMVVKL
jgi:hypothetical protein